MTHFPKPDSGVVDRLKAIVGEGGWRDATDAERYFDDPDFFVEKFLPERDGELYCVNFYKFLGDSELCQKLWSTEPVITGSGIVKRENIEPDPAIRSLRHSLNLDYGKMDYCLHNGAPVLVDANKTVGLARSRRTPEEISHLYERARGIEKYF